MSNVPQSYVTMVAVVMADEDYARYRDAGTATMHAVISAVEGKSASDALTVMLVATPTATDTHQSVDAGTVTLVSHPSGVDIKLP